MLHEEAQGGDGHLLCLSYGRVVELLFHSHGSHVFLNTCLYELEMYSNTHIRRILLVHGC